MCTWIFYSVAAEGSPIVWRLVISQCSNIIFVQIFELLVKQFYATPEVQVDIQSDDFFITKDFWKKRSKMKGDI